MHVAGIAVCLAIVAALVPAALAGPVEVYREGPRYCPRERPKTAPRIDAQQAIERAQQLLPDLFCGPTWYVSGCEFDPEQGFDSWRVYVHQYKVDGGRHVLDGRDHTYIVLDAVGNCLAHIPGTPLGAPR